MRPSVFRQAAQVLFVLLPIDVTRMRLEQQRVPLLPGLTHRRTASPAVGSPAKPRPPIGKRSGIARAPQDLDAMTVGEGNPEQLTFPRPPRGRRGNSKPCSRNDRTVAQALPVRRKVANSRRMLCCTCRSGSRITSPLASYTSPTGRGMASSPRLALFRTPPRMRALITCSSASDIAPFIPRRSLSLN